jgi:hypothetical protein
MDRNLHKKYVPQCPRHAAVVDQYMWADKDTNRYKCYNGISHPIYDCKGWINFSLPLEYYPPVDRVHPQIEMTRRMHLNWRGDPYKEVAVNEGYQYLANDVASGRTEGFYSGTLPREQIYTTNYNEPGYPLPNPNGTRGCSACGC